MASRYLQKRNQLVQPKAPPGDVQKVIDLLKPQAAQSNLVRIGGDGDGGYLVADDFDGIGACFSPGVSTVATFETMLAENYGIPCYLADFSVAKPPVDSPLFDFEKKFLGQRNDDIHTRLEDWIARKEKVRDLGDLILQMDIEGSEYGVLVDTPQAVLDRFRIIVVELHGLHRLANRGSLPLLRAMFEKLTANHVVVHLHPNNYSRAVTVGDIVLPNLMEVTLLRRDRFTGSDRTLAFPHPLDQKNVPQNDDFVLPHAWY